MRRENNVVFYALALLLLLVACTGPESARKTSRQEAYSPKPSPDIGPAPLCGQVTGLTRTFLLNDSLKVVFDQPMASFTLDEWEPDTLWKGVSVLARGRRYPVDPLGLRTDCDMEEYSLYTPIRAMVVSKDGKLLCFSSLCLDSAYFHEEVTKLTPRQPHLTFEERGLDINTIYLDLHRRCRALLVEAVDLRGFSQGLGDCLINPDGSVINSRDDYEPIRSSRYYLITEVIRLDRLWMRQHRRALSQQRLKDYQALRTDKEMRWLARPYQQEFALLFADAQRYAGPNKAKRGSGK